MKRVANAKQVNGYAGVITVGEAKSSGMKRLFLSLTMGLVMLTGFSLMTATAQDEEVSESKVSFFAGTDVYSSYIWRGTYFSGASFQPTLEMSIGSFSVGAWGSFDFIGSFAEADLYAAYDFDFGLSLGATGYYYPGTSYFEFSDTISSHAVEANVGYGLGDFYVSANYIFNNSSMGAGSVGGDMYFEVGYAFPGVTLAVGAGDGWHTSTGEFEVCNISISSEREIQFTEKFSLPISASAILNPQTEQFYIVVGISF